MVESAEIKSRIMSVADTKKITDAMYMISSVKMRQAQKEVENTAPYFNALKEEIAVLYSRVPDIADRYFKLSEEAVKNGAKRAILLITSDKGLAGAYNHTSLNQCAEYVSSHNDTLLFVIGEYGRQYLMSKGIPFISDFNYSASVPTVWRARLIVADLLEYFDDGRVDEIEILYTDHINGGFGKCKQTVLLPLELSGLIKPSAESDETEYFPSAKDVLLSVIPSYLTGFVYNSLVDGYCSEQQARMTAMSTASHNAEEMLKDLKLKYNRLRQASITREITEVTSGARALKRNKKV